MEKEKVQIPFSEKLKSIPGFFGFHMNETPKYILVKEEDGVEVRQYPPMMVARTTVPGPREEARETAFTKLAGYIFGKNQGETELDEGYQSGQQMAMTSPVFQEFAQEAFFENLTMSFVLPSEIQAQTAPLPNDQEIKLEKIPVQTWAVIRYSGTNSPEDIKQKYQELRKWIMDHGYKVDLASWRM